MKRCGLVVQKLGMTQIFDGVGRALPVTLLHAPCNIIIGVKTFEKDGYSAVILGYGVAKGSRVSKPLLGMLNKVGVEPVKGLREFLVSCDYSQEIGKRISVNHFVKEQYVDVIGESIGKGFAGSMKRHNFSGLEASHGVSISHRAHGSTGQRQDPGKVFKGKKMAGHMGCRSVTVQNLRVVDIDEASDIVVVLGCVPGTKGKWLVLRDSIKKSLPLNAAIPSVYAD